MTSVLSQHRFIVIGSQHYNNVGLCKSINEAGLNVTLVEISGNSKPYKFTKRHVQSFIAIKSIDEGIQYVVTHCRDDEHKPFIFTGQDDVIVALDIHYNELIDHFYFFNCGERGAANRFMSKQNMYGLLRAHTHTHMGVSLKTAKWEQLHSGECPRTLSYPIITKVSNPNLGAWKNDVYICYSEKELLEAWGQIKSNEIIAQEYIDKKTDLTVNGFSIKGGNEVKCVSVVRYLRHSAKGYGFYMQIEPIDDYIPIDGIAQIIKDMKYSGIFGVDFIVDKDGKLHFCEVNLRNDAFGYATTYAGINLPYEWAKATFEKKIDLNERRSRIKTCTAMVAPNDIKQIVNYKVGALKWLWQYITVDCLFDMDKKTPWPLWALIKALRMGIVKMWFKSTFKLYKEEDYPLAF